jgi:arginase family enzyme
MKRKRFALYDDNSTIPIKRGQQKYCYEDYLESEDDVLEKVIMPAVDYHLDGGLFSDLSELLKIVLKSGRAVGMDITILNPDLDVDGSITRKFVSSVVSGLSFMKTIPI